MVTKSQQQAEAFRSEVIHACETLYGEGDRGVYFLVKDATADVVKKQILDELSKTSTNQEFIQKKYIDMVAYILTSGNDVAIKMI